jgi:hypothetical protein
MPQFRTGTLLNLSKIVPTLEDNSYFSKDYFVLSEFTNEFGLGKNSFIINRPPTDLKVEILDSNGMPLYYETASDVDFIDKTNAVIISAHVYEQTGRGIGKLILVGTFNGRVVRYSIHVNVDVERTTRSKVRFYSPPVFEVSPALTFASNIGEMESNPKILSGSFYSTPVYPTKNFMVDEQSYDRNRLKYVITSKNSAFSASAKNFFGTFHVKSVRDYSSPIERDVNETASILVRRVKHNRALELDFPITTYSAYNKKSIITEVVSGSYTISYSDYTYSPTLFTTASYVTESVDFAGNVRFKQYSIADISYRNLRTFSGIVSRHKLYRKSLNLAGEYQLILDENLLEAELLRNYTSPIKTFENIGTFYNQTHINNFWFTSSNSIQLTANSDYFIDGMIISGSMPVNSQVYIICKANTINTNRNASYIPFNETEYSNQSGSSYDSNFIKLIRDNDYILSFNANILSKDINSSSSLKFYFTSSTPARVNELSHSAQYGLLLGDLSISDRVSSRNFGETINLKFSTLNDLFGTIVIVPSGINSVAVSDISVKLDVTRGFSQNSYHTRILFPVNFPNELYDIKAELYDVDSNLIYSNLRSIVNFDASGSSSPVQLTSNTISASSLYISSSFGIGYLENLGALQTGKRILGWESPTGNVGFYYFTQSVSSGSGTSSGSWQTPPTSPTDYGEEGWQAYDNDYYYIYVTGRWRRNAISDFE